ncbi:uncharacterized protein [Fopius arisanus]|uniref:Uncharacterized protein n=2 Tax=Fopius arisanus TaxID=64838 RepID=A0A9R1TNP3_9HYME|nr:PREDICTED: uncharacterized protein LOC105272107 [Fopius arisanus]
MQYLLSSRLFIIGHTNVTVLTSSHLASIHLLIIQFCTEKLFGTLVNPNTMGWAQIFNPRSGKHNIIDGAELEGFSIVAYLKENPQERVKKIYKRILDNGKTVKVQVLAAHGKLEELQKITNGKRIAIPKLNTSLFDDSMPQEVDEDGEVSVKNTKKKRKDSMKKYIESDD